MNKLLQNMISAGAVSDKLLPNLYGNKLPKAKEGIETKLPRVGANTGKSEEDIRQGILNRAAKLMAGTSKPYKIPKNLVNIGANSKYVCIEGVCGILEDEGLIPKDYYTNTKFAEKANEFGFSNPLYDINKLKTGDVFQHLVDQNESGTRYPSHAEIFKGWSKDGKNAEFYDYYDHYSGKSGIRTYTRKEIEERLNRKRNKDNSGKQAQFFSISGQPQYANKFPYNLPEKEQQEYFNNTHASNVTYGVPKTTRDPNSLSVIEKDRLKFKNQFVDYFNDKKLDEDLRRNVKLADQDLQKIKPLIYGIIGQETNYDNPESGYRQFKYSMEKEFPNAFSSTGIGQVNVKSISPEVREKYNIKTQKDLLDYKKNYIALVDILGKAPNYADKYITKESHPDLVDKDRFERALYFLNSPTALKNSDEQNYLKAMNSAPFLSNLKEDWRQNNVKKALSTKLSMDENSYPTKVLNYANQLNRTIDFNDVDVLPEVLVKSVRKVKKQFGGDIKSLPGVLPLSKIKNDLAVQKSLENFKNKPKNFISNVEPKRSAISKGWAVLSHPMTALSYKVKGQDIPEHFDRGEKNIVEMATDVLNPFFYANSGMDAISGLYEIGKDPINNINQLPNVVLNGLGAIPLLQEASVLGKTFNTAGKQFRSTFQLTNDLPIKKRIINAINSSALTVHNPYEIADVTSHSYFNMSPEEVSKAMREEIKTLPKGSVSSDHNMSKNSAPLFWTEAARQNKDFTIVRSGTGQKLNWSGTHGKRVANAIPKDIEKYIPDELNQIKEDLELKINYLKSLGDPESLKQAARLTKEGLSSEIVASLPGITYSNTNGTRLMNEFLTNYKPTLDEPIKIVNKNTGLNFPLTKINNFDQPSSLPIYEMPSIHSVKGSPIKDRLIPFLKDYAKERVNKLYFESPLPNSYKLKLNQLPDPPDYISFKNGGPILDPRGQWAHPGQITRIPSNQITMEGVPYPVLGIGNNGQQQMMYPGQDYNFNNADYVDEYPMLQKGGIPFVNQYNFLQPTSNKLPIGYMPGVSIPSTERAGSIGGENGEDAYLIPEFKYGRPLVNPVLEFDKTGDMLGGPFDTWQEADEWERTIRHPYVEKGKNIPTPIKTWSKNRDYIGQPRKVNTPKQNGGETLASKIISANANKDVAKEYYANQERLIKSTKSPLNIPTSLNHTTDNSNIKSKGLILRNDSIENVSGNNFLKTNKGGLNIDSVMNTFASVSNNSKLNYYSKDDGKMKIFDKYPIIKNKKSKFNFSLIN